MADMALRFGLESPDSWYLWTTHGRRCNGARSGPGETGCLRGNAAGERQKHSRSGLEARAEPGEAAER